jgi:glycosyltransferase involved in cell wall biosynthesis
MKLLFVLTYYYPHVSGLTIYVQLLAEALAARGHQVTVLASRHHAELPRDEILNGVRVVRVPAAVRVGKGSLMPSYVRVAPTLVRESDVVILNLPNSPVETAITSLLTRLARRPLIAAYYCDLNLPPGLFNRTANTLVHLSNVIAGFTAERVIALTEDYARQSGFLRRFAGKCEIISPAVQMSQPDPSEVLDFRRRHTPDNAPLIGFAARFAAEKGVEALLAALPLVRESIPGVKVLFTGDPKSVVGEERYWRRLQPQLVGAREYITFLGMLEPSDLPAFYAACDVTILPSVNSTEAFGLVQLESMLCGTPVVASDLPGVRVPVATTGMGRLVPPRNPALLAGALVDIIQNRRGYERPRSEIEKAFPFAETVGRYEDLLRRIVQDRKAIPATT